MFRKHVLQINYIFDRLSDDIPPQNKFFEYSYPLITYTSIVDIDSIMNENSCL